MSRDRDQPRNFKMLQSELGVTGECSEENIVIMDHAQDLLFDQFEHTHGTITNDDAFIIISQCCVGDKINKKTKGFTYHYSRKGCDHNLTDVFAEVFSRDVSLMLVVIDALNKIAGKQ